MQDRREKTIEAARKYKTMRDKGDRSGVEKMPGFHPAYNDFIWAVYHASVPFRMVHPHVGSCAKAQEDIIMSHPLRLAKGKSQDQYESMPPLPPPPLPSRII